MEIGPVTYLWLIIEATQSWFLADEVSAVGAPLIGIVSPKGKIPAQDLQRTPPVVAWRNRERRQVGVGAGSMWPWSRAAQLPIRYSKTGFFKHLTGLIQERTLSLGLVVLDGTVIRVHHQGGGRMNCLRRCRHA